MVDIDLLAHKEDLLKVHEILLQQGYTCADGRVSGHVHLAPYEKDNAMRPYGRELTTIPTREWMS